MQRYYIGPLSTRVIEPQDPGDFSDVIGVRDRPYTALHASSPGYLRIRGRGEAEGEAEREFALPSLTSRSPQQSVEPAAAFGTRLPALRSTLGRELLTLRHSGWDLKSENKDVVVKEQLDDLALRLSQQIEEDAVAEINNAKKYLASKGVTESVPALRVRQAQKDLYYVASQVQLKETFPGYDMPAFKRLVAETEQPEEKKKQQQQRRRRLPAVPYEQISERVQRQFA